MNLADMRVLVRRDLHDEETGNYRWTDDELNRHINHAVKEFSEYIPLEQKATKATTAGSRELDITSITERVKVEAVEYPTDKFPGRYQRFSLWGNILTMLGDEVPDGSNAYIYYGKLHTLDGSSSTIPAQYEDLIAGGSCGYAAIELVSYTINRVNVGGAATPGELAEWGDRKLKYFRKELKRLGRRNRVSLNTLYEPYFPNISKTTDYGP